ncbi:hypothetical protein HMPREF0591_1698 [Mycobacterium parascrofulaceum ATCC BAA-614]|uniref:Uncharacterized protein n=1 Tax=Mycobacterium parascrofulaceum ATCC BAA-614 TaxID=525368 RepID=D5P6A4_9MYCO|nr:DUF6338 family protein [Mycobacterium parascrofulaceum]EFG78406.1 hypothetical protein HMPREF0591_1698 [Mycobacterium parascrofulaceum ATCC BAA-614]
MLISGWQQALTLVGVLVPGFVFQGVRRNRIGPSPEDRELSVRLVRALAVSVAFLLFYLVCLGETATHRLFHPQDGLGDPRAVAGVGFLLVFMLPALAGYVTASFTTRRRYNRTTFWGTLFERASGDGELTWRKALFSHETDYSPIPTAWDFATQDVAPGSFVRILTADGTWIGGRVTNAAFFTGYPEPRDVYIDEAWSIDTDGQFTEQLTGPTGQWVRCDDAVLMQIIPPPDP